MLAPELHDQGILIEPDSREPWFVCEAHIADCLEQTLDKFERAVDITLEKFPKEQESTTDSYGKYLASNNA